MTIDRQQYPQREPRRGKGREKVTPMMVNVRLQKIRPRGDPPPTKQEAEDALRSALDTGELPRSNRPGARYVWRMALIEWKKPHEGDDAWRRQYNVMHIAAWRDLLQYALDSGTLRFGSVDDE